MMNFAINSMFNGVIKMYSFAVQTNNVLMYCF